MEAEAFDALVGAMDGAMLVVTASADGERDGCLLGFHSQSSIEPRRYVVWVSKANRTYAIARRATHLGVHVLTADDFELARTFGTESGDDVDKFATWPAADGPHGVPLLHALPNRMVGRRIAVLEEAGDHVAMVLEPIQVDGGSELDPLRLSEVLDLEAGHDPTERHAT